MNQAGSLEPARRLCMRALLLAPLLLSACASPDWVDPNTWFADEPPQPQVVAIPEDNSEVPNLASVPSAPPVPSPQVQRQAIAQGLTADRADARYSDQPLTVETTAVPEAAPPSPNAPVPDSFSVARVGESDDVSTASLAAPPPPFVPGSGAVGASPVRPGTAAAGQPMLLQTQAYQQLAQQAQQMQQAAFQRQALEQQARQKILEQQFLRQQVIDQQSLQRRSLELQARQLAALGPVPSASALAPQAYDQPAPGAAPQLSAAPAYQSSPAYPAANPALGGGNLVAIIYFQHGSSGIGGRDRQVLRQVSSLAQQSGASLQVIGHASARTGTVDPVRHRMANFDVSMRRANIVAKALVGMGTAQERMNVAARSDSQPVYHEFMSTGEAGNRRVEIYLAN